MFSLETEFRQGGESEIPKDSVSFDRNDGTMVGQPSCLFEVRNVVELAFFKLIYF